MFSEDFIKAAQELLEACRKNQKKIVTAESCTGGLIAALLTEIPGSSDVFERGFVTYSNLAKMEHLGVLQNTLETYGAVSQQTASEMALGALKASQADLSVSVTGVAGPGGSSTEKPVGLVHIAVACKNNVPLHKECRFGHIGRTEIRRQTVKESLQLLKELNSIS